MGVPHAAPHGPAATGTRFAAELKTMKEPLGWNHAIGLALIAGGAGFVFSGRGG
jgi:hypothetical protein